MAYVKPSAAIQSLGLLTMESLTEGRHVAYARSSSGSCQHLTPRLLAVPIVAHAVPVSGTEGTSHEGIDVVACIS